MLETILTLDCRTLAKRDPFKLAENLEERHKIAKYVSLIEEYAVKYIRKNLPEIQESSFVSDKESVLTMEKKGFKATFTDNNGIEKVGIQYDKKNNSIVNMLGTLFKIFGRIANSEYQQVSKLPKLSLAHGNFKSNDSSLQIYKSRGDFYINFANNKNNITYKV